jgi:hypothetical protein
MKPVVTLFEVYILEYKKAGSHAKRQAQNIYTRINLIPYHIPPGGFEVTLKHI